MNPVSNAAIKDLWPQFVGVVLGRLELGSQRYGDSSFDLPFDTLEVQIEEELADVTGWGFILWCRMRWLKEQVRRLEADGLRPVLVQPAVQPNTPDGDGSGSTGTLSEMEHKHTSPMDSMKSSEINGLDGGAGESRTPDWRFCRPLPSTLFSTSPRNPSNFQSNQSTENDTLPPPTGQELDWYYDWLERELVGLYSCTAALCTAAREVRPHLNPTVTQLAGELATKADEVACVCRLISGGAK